jgi:hypothetical protein
MVKNRIEERDPLLRQAFVPTIGMWVGAAYATWSIAQ